MKLLSDFDGVWTDPTAEGQAHGEVLEELLLEWTPEAERAGVGRWLRDARAASARQPTRYGWAPGGGALSAFGDEDPFAHHGALLHYIHLRAGEDAIAAALIDAARRHGHADLDALGGHAHRAGVERVAQARGPALLPEATAAGRRLLAGGVEIVVVSNSGAEKLERWFRHAGLPARTERGDGAAAILLRGGARKFILGPDPGRSQRLLLEDLEFEVARPHYERVLREERPDAVVGDVFSLDLALPLALRRREPEWSAVRLFWLVRDYTPEWLRERIARAAPEVELLSGGLSEVADRLLAGVPAQRPAS